MQKFDFSEIEITGSTGEPLIIDGLHKQLGDTLFFDNKHNLAIYELGKKIAANQPFDISENELNELLKYVEEWQLALHVKIPFLTYLKHLQNGNTTIEPVTEPEITDLNTETNV